LPSAGEETSRQDPRAHTGTPALRAEMTNDQIPNDQRECSKREKRVTGLVFDLGPIGHVFNVTNPVVLAIAVE
jgi:hypothetical protein